MVQMYCPLTALAELTHNMVRARAGMIRRVIVKIAFISSYMDAILGWKILAHLFFLYRDEVME